MNYIDILILLIMGLSVWVACQRGFILSALMLFTWIGSLVVAFLIYRPLSSVLHAWIPSLGFWAEPLSFIGILVLSRILLETLSSKIIGQVPPGVHLNALNRILGAIPGLVNGLIWAAFLATLFLLMPFTRISEATRESKSSGMLVDKVAWLEAKLSPVFSEALGQFARRTIIKDDKEATVKLPFVTETAKERPDLAAEMLVLINQERKKENLPALKADPELAVVSLNHSRDMLARGYFSHYTPEGLSPFDRIKKAAVRFITAGENLALAPTLKQAHTGLMNSPGHRANILNTRFGRVGIGILDAGIYGIVITQNFRN